MSLSCKEVFRGLSRLGFGLNLNLHNGRKIVPPPEAKCGIKAYLQRPSHQQGVVGGGGGVGVHGREGERERETEREREIDFLAGFLPMVSLALDLLIRFS